MYRVICQAWYTSKMRTEQAIPKLEQTVLKLLQGDVNDFMTRVLLMRSSHVPVDFLLECWLLANERGSWPLVVEHEVAYSAADYQRQLEEFLFGSGFDGENNDFSVLKTVTAVFFIPDSKAVAKVLISGFGDFHITKDDKRQIVAALGLENESARGAILNPHMQFFDTWESVQYEGGLVKPMIEASFVQNIDAICIKKPEVKSEHVAFTATLLESVIISSEVFDQVFEQYATDYLNLSKVLSDPNLDLWVA